MQQHVRGRTGQLSDISSGATCVADLDSRALALALAQTKEASGNSPSLISLMVSVDVKHHVYLLPCDVFGSKSRLQTDKIISHRVDN